MKNQISPFWKAFNDRLAKYPSWILPGSIGGILFFSILFFAMMKYQLDTLNILGDYELTLDFVRDYLRTNVLCSVVFALLLLSCLGLISCPFIALIEGLVALIPIRKPLDAAVIVSTTTDSNATVLSSNDNRAEPRVCQINLNKDMLKLLFSESFSDDMFNDFCSKIEEKSNIYCKRNYGEIALIILEKSKYASQDTKYKRKSKGDMVPNFKQYLNDFYQALGITKPYSEDKGYYDTQNSVVFNDFKAILGIE